MFDFETANDAQREAIRTTEGPLLIIAGPGTGKTYTLVQRAMYMIQEKGVRPENLFLATFTEKAAKELLTRLNGRDGQARNRRKRQRDVHRDIPFLVPADSEGKP